MFIRKVIIVVLMQVLLLIKWKLDVHHYTVVHMSPL